MISGERKMRFGSILAGIREKVLEAGIGYEDISPILTAKEYKEELDKLPEQNEFDFEDML
jgi:hypothetical protein